MTAIDAAVGIIGGPDACHWDDVRHPEVAVDDERPSVRLNDRVVIYGSRSALRQFAVELLASLEQVPVTVLDLAVESAAKYRTGARS